MYDVEFEYQGAVMRLSMDTGVVIGTISGLTGVSAAFGSVQNVSGSGASIVSSQTAPKALSIGGYILDGQTSVKQRLMDFFKPARHMTMYVNTRNGTSDTQRAYRADVYVKTSPMYSQEYHSKFVLELVMPVPYFEEITAREITLGSSTEILGDADPEYTLQFAANADDVYGVTFWCDYGLARHKSVYLDFTKTTAGKLMTNDTVKIYRDNGIIKALVNSASAMPILYTQSDLWYLPLGSHVFTLVNSALLKDISLSYRSLHSGVLVDGV